MPRGEKVILRPLEKADLPNHVRWLNGMEVLEHLNMYRPLTQTAR